MYYRFGKAIYLFGVLLFVFVLLYFYSALPERVSVQMDSLGNSSWDIEKGVFFYVMIFCFVLLNGLVLLPPKLLETKSHQGLRRIFPVGDVFRDYFLTWFYSFGFIINLSLGLMVFYAHSINNQNEIASSDYNVFFYSIPVLFLVWVIGFFLILLGKFKQVQQNS
jgi:hypothetical protein